jgi:teichuronic acid biosynthesis glycosyltransferase TuaH
MRRRDLHRFDMPFDVAFISHTADRGSFRVGSHHLAREFARSGLSVIHISTQRSLLHLIRDIVRNKRLWPQLRQTDAHGVTHLIPLSFLPAQWSPVRHPGILWPTLRKISAKLVFIDQPLMAGIPGKYFPDATVLYRPTDTYGSGPAARRQSELLAKVSGVIATSTPVLERLAVSQDLRAIVIENGVEYEHFSSTVQYQRNGFIYVGALDHRFDWHAVRTIAQELPWERFDLFGPLHGSQPDLPINVKLHGAVDYQNLPSLLRQYRVGLIPLSSSDVNVGRSPMKYYEYLAAELFVLASETPALLSRDAPGVVLYSNSEEANRAAAILISSDQLNVAGAQIAAKQDWSEKSKQILDFVRGL